MSKTRVLAVSAVLLVAAVGAGCGSSSPSGSGGTGSGDCTTTGSAYTLVAKNIAWQTTSGTRVKCLEAKAGEQVTFTVDNKDTVAHNLHIEGNGVNATTKLEAGPVKQTLRVKVDKPGTYQFVCDIHSNMEGTYKVVK